MTAVSRQESALELECLVESEPLRKVHILAPAARIDALGTLPQQWML